MLLQLSLWSLSLTLHQLIYSGGWNTIQIIRRHFNYTLLYDQMLYRNKWWITLHKLQDNVVPAQLEHNHAVSISLSLSFGPKWQAWTAVYFCFINNYDVYPWLIDTGNVYTIFIQRNKLREITYGKYVQNCKNVTIFKAMAGEVYAQVSKACSFHTSIS